ncbi:hypothetical protein L596_028957 [Steinernema carpocapsae]|uniref:Peptidase M13 C-terminal domain-containing protein n=1 Tax=Steinernema carpocapsae TaxID=34508 RepID=A0A4U5LT61_STECR|nr:hypothetical protein L596_028957 [Steinernema carpocapsae]
MPKNCGIVFRLLSKQLSTNRRDKQQKLPTLQHHPPFIIPFQRSGLQKLRNTHKAKTDEQPSTGEPTRARPSLGIGVVALHQTTRGNVLLRSVPAKNDPRILAKSTKWRLLEPLRASATLKMAVFARFWIPLLLLVSVCLSQEKDAGDTFAFPQLFSTKVKPCKDLNKFVCNPMDNSATDLFETERFKSMQGIIDGFFLKSDDVFVKKFKEVIKRNLIEKNTFKKGEKVGKEARYGRIQSFIPIPTISEANGSLTLKFHGTHEDEYGTCEYSQCSSLIQGIASGFNLNSSYKLVEFQRLPKDSEDFQVAPPIEKEIEKALLLEIKSNKASYFYMIWARQMIEEKVFSDEFLKQLKEIFDSILEEAISMIQECHYLKSDEKSRIDGYLKNGLGKVLGFPDVFYNRTALDEAIEFTRSRFKDNVRRLHREEGSCVEHPMECGSCILKRYTEALLVSEKSHRSANPEFDDGLDRANEKASLLGYNALNKFTHLILLPAYIHIFQNRYPLGFLYGSLGGTIAHEIFHSLGLRRTPFMETFQHHNHKEFVHAMTCYDNYYSSFTLKHAKEPALRPNGEVKSEEGFADVEGARIAFRALQKVAGEKKIEKRAEERGLRFDRFSDSQWFFPEDRTAPISPSEDRHQG